MLDCSPIHLLNLKTSNYVDWNFKYLNVGLLQVMRPSSEQVLSHLLIKVASVGNECC